MALHHHHHHDPTNQGISSAPHDPETGDDHASIVGPPLQSDEAKVLKSLIYPDDTYTSEGTYWADLPFGKQLAFNAKVDMAEAAKELRSTGYMIKEDALSPVAWYFKNAVLPGAGLGLEGYVSHLYYGYYS
jgi:hypothetical protein